jgi:DNA-binding transcriptional LysR family regulator
VDTARPDLNLVVALHALLEECHVSRAAVRIGVGQPAASTMLARLRRHFGDELLTRVGNHYELTPLGLLLRDQSTSVLEVNDRLFATKKQFDPTTTNREFLIVMSDYALALLGPQLTNFIEEQAPHARLRFRLYERRHSEPGGVLDQAGLIAVDGAILPHEGSHDEFPHVDLHQDTWVCVVAKENQLIGADPTLAELAALRWVVAYYNRNFTTTAMARLQAHGVVPPVHVVVDSFQVLPRLVTRSNRVGLLPRRVADTIEPSMGLRILPFPLEAGPLEQAFWWHPAHTLDPGHTWFRNTLLSSVAASLGQDTDDTRSTG